MVEPGVLVVRDDGVIPVDAATPWPTALAAVAEHTIVNLIGEWPTTDDELWWPTEKAMQEA